MTNNLIPVAHELSNGLAAAAQINSLSRENAAKIQAKTSIVCSEIMAKSIQNCGYEISRGIINSSKNLFLGLNRIADELEQNNKIQEYYMLLNEIEKFEDYCIQHNIIKSVYEKIDLNPIKEINEDEENITLDEAKGFVVLMGNKICDIEEIAVRSLMSPISVVATSILKHSGLDLGISLPCYDNITRELLATNTLSGVRKAILYSGCNDYHILKEEYTVEQEKFISQHATKILDMVHLINQNICLINLRTLHAKLRSAVREHKITTAMAICNN